MAAQEMMSPIRRKAQELPPLTPSMAGASSIQPSPNRTEAAAAMMHLLTGSSSQETNTCPALKPTKPSGDMCAEPQEDQDGVDGLGRNSNGEAPSQSRSDVQDTEDGDKDAKNGDWRMDGDEVKFFPFREYNRKDKSLGLLCENFLKLYRDDKISEICLDRAATELGVERRRIYDIVNILESIHLVSRKSKNLYNWHGLASLPTSISAMKQRYAEMQKASPTGSSGTEYPPIKSDRRRGKSLSKLSQMFVQLFLGKEDCIIPLDQAAKQLIQMEDSESEEDRLLKTKIRRLYDVANVLVSVGLIEKLQLSNSRKPVFRWKTRSAAATPSTTQANSTFTADESENKPAQPLFDSVPSVDMEDTDVIKSSQSCDSDMFDDGSDSQSDSSSCGSKRKQTDQDGSDVSMSDGESSSKRSRLSERKSSMDKRSPQPAGEKRTGLLRLDANNEPIHPQTILSEQQEQVKLYMQQYIREYLPDATILTNSAEVSASKPNAIWKDIHGTPVSLPSLAGSIQDLLLSESPQSVADIVAARVMSNPLPASATSPVAPEPEDEANSRPLILSVVKRPKLTSSTSTKTGHNFKRRGSVRCTAESDHGSPATLAVVGIFKRRNRRDLETVEMLVVTSWSVYAIPAEVVYVNVSQRESMISIACHGV
ncbi:E2F Family [Phytophthora cactorum]|nr:E2F Family [Phytophthora cactorum]